MQSIQNAWSKEIRLVCESGKIALRGFVSRARGSRVWAVQARKRNGRRRRCSRLLGPVIRLGTPNPSAQPAGR